MSEVYLLMKGEVLGCPEMIAAYQYEWQVRAEAEDLVKEYNKKIQQGCVNPEDYYMTINPIIQHEITDHTIEYWESHDEFIRIDKWEII